MITWRRGRINCAWSHLTLQTSTQSTWVGLYKATAYRHAYGLYLHERSMIRGLQLYISSTYSSGSFPLDHTRQLNLLSNNHHANNYFDARSCELSYAHCGKGCETSLPWINAGKMLNFGETTWLLDRETSWCLWTADWVQKQPLYQRWRCMYCG